MLVGLLLGLTAAAVGYGCESEPLEPKSEENQGGAEADGATRATGGSDSAAGRASGGVPAGRGGDASVVGSAGEQTIPEGYWQPTGDAEWAAVPWAPDCQIEAAANPEHGMPQLRWKACQGVSGCVQVVPNWYLKSQIYLGFTAGYRDGAAVRLGVGTGWGDDTEWRYAVYDEAWRPLAVWRGPRRDCNGVSPRPRGAHTCFVAAKLDGKAVAGVLPATNLKAAPLSSYETLGRLGVDCTDQLVINFDTSGRVFIHDLKAGAETLLALSAGEAMPPAAYADQAFFSRWYSKDGVEAMDGWVWTPSGGAQPLVVPETKFVADIRTDGKALAWLELDMTTVNHPAAGELWTSPVTTTMAKVEHKLVRSVPSAHITRGYKAIGGGFYALVEQHDDKSVKKVHLYRLADGRHWEIPTPSDLLPAAIIWLTEQELAYAAELPSGASHSIIRHDLTKLGEGD